jgi:hypothetical protein
MTQIQTQQDLKKKTLEIRYRLPIKVFFFYPAQPYRFQISLALYYVYACIYLKVKTLTLFENKDFEM